LKTRTIDFLKALRGTYCLVFFSNSSLFSILLIVASFIDPCVGLAGLICGVFAVLLSKVMGLNPLYIQNGTYSFNALLTGLALGAYFKITGNFLIILVMASALTLLITVLFASFSERNKLPFLSLPFILTLWIILLNARSFETSFLIPKDAMGCSVLWSQTFKDLSLQIEKKIPTFISVYFKALGAVFFQSHIVSGLLIALGLLLYSRIAFMLSFLGFLSGLIYFRFVQGNLNDHEYSQVAFNYILAALALGGYFVISSTRSFVLVIFTVPVLGLLITALYKITSFYALPLYSLPFSVVVILVMSLLNGRYFFKNLPLVYIQQFSPEKNLYAFQSFMQRFKNATGVAIHLPFFGEWTVSQGHDGKMTHKEDYRYALDFVVTDEHKRTFKFPGKKVTDFFCYGLPVLAPADGQVITIEDGIEDNEIGDANLEQNWGNTIVIKHSENLYSKLSHLKKGSFKVKQGDNIKKGDLLAVCGNSGRSPEPHLHFQLQSYEYIGAATIDVPISSYVIKSQDTYQLKFFEVPAEGEILLRPVASPILKKAFHFIPGMKFKFELEEGSKNFVESWEVITDSLNASYIQCNGTKSRAYFSCNDTLFYFTGFEGDSKCLLFYFFLAAYKIVLSQFDNLQIKDRLSIEGTQKGILKIVQDFLAPFYIFIKPEYSSSIKEVENSGLNKIEILSKVTSNMPSGRNMDFEIELCENKINRIKIIERDKCITAKAV